MYTIYLECEVHVGITLRLSVRMNIITAIPAGIGITECHPAKSTGEKVSPAVTERFEDVETAKLMPRGDVVQNEHVSTS
jgi:hypothetical protein